MNKTSVFTTVPGLDRQIEHIVSEANKSATTYNGAVQVDSSDTTPGYANDKLKFSTGLSSSIVNAGANESIAVINADRGSTAVATHTSASDPHTQYLLLSGRTGGQTVVEPATANAITVGVTSAITQASGGGASAIPIGIKGTADVTGGTFNHAVGFIGWTAPGAASVAGDYRGGEGRVDTQKAGCTGTGLVGLTYLDVADASGTTNYALAGNAEVGPSYASNGTNVGLWAYGRGAANNYNAIFGQGTTSGDNAPVVFRGYITDGAGVANVSIQVNDAFDQLLINLQDAKIDGATMLLRDNAGYSNFTVMNSDYTPVFQMTSAGVTSAVGLCRWRGSSGSDPSPAVEGDQYFNTVDSKVYCYAGSAWRALT